MTRRGARARLGVGVGLAALLAGDGACPERACADEGEPALVSPRTQGSTSLEQVLARRRSVRTFAPRDVTWSDVGQLAWAAQGVTAAPLRTAPSAGALYPIELYVATRQGLFIYEPATHRVRLKVRADVRPRLAAHALGQAAVAEAPVSFVFVGVVSRTQAKYGARAERYVALEAGHAAQNLWLQATALGLGAVTIGAFDDRGIRDVLGAPADHLPLYVVPVGYAR